MGRKQELKSQVSALPASIAASSSSVSSSDCNSTGCATPRGTQQTAEIMSHAPAAPRAADGQLVTPVKPSDDDRLERGPTRSHLQAAVSDVVACSDH